MKKLLTNVGAAFVFADSTFGSEATTSTYMGEPLEVLGHEKEWTRIRQTDGYEGWLADFYMVPEPEGWDRHPRFSTNELIADIRESPDFNSSRLRDVTLLSSLPLLDRRDGWVEVMIPDGTRGWIPDVPREEHGTPEVENLVALAFRFLGIQYNWGGKTPKGFDCSGFIQTTFHLNGLDLPRDSYVQGETGVDLPGNWEAWQAGDLLFFSSTGIRITHVAMALGDGDFIHSSGFVKINSLNPRHDDLFSEKLQRNFVKAKRVLK